MRTKRKASVAMTDPRAEKHLGLNVSPQVWQEVRAAATARNLTIRSLVLTALRDAGVKIPAVEIEDRRK